MIKNNIRGMTFTELLVATILMGIVMIGIVSVDFAIRGMQKNVSRDTFVTMRTSAAMLDMAKNAAAMTGDQNNLGFNSNPLTNPDRFCFREDVNSSGGLNNTPDDYKDDHWICYQQITTNISKCNNGIPSDCPAGSFILGTAVAGGLSILFTPDSIAQNSSIAISIKNRFDPAQAASSQDNPEVTMTTKVSPAIQSF